MSSPDPSGYGGPGDFDAFLAEAHRRASDGTPVIVPIRALLWGVGAERRGARVLRVIQDELDGHRLVSEPSFASGWVDSDVRLVLAMESPPSSGPEDNALGGDGTAAFDEVSLTVRSLESATQGVTGVERTSDLLRARALMLRYDFSQLAVMSGARQLMGAVSWESMALAAIREPAFDLRDATVPARTVDLDDDLIGLIPTIAEKGFLFVAKSDRTLAGIVTTADLSLQFATLAGPFLLIGEIERRLRQVLAARFPASELAGLGDPADSDRTIESASDLTLGETLRFVENPEHWDRLGWPVQRSEFISGLNEVKDIRNEVMHFSPDPLSKEQEDALSNFVRWLRAMEAPR
jgi:CBS domain-containing protein